MVTFCVGNVGLKRRAFLKAETGTVCADNDDVLLSFRLSGKLYCALGAIPFADLTVREYMAYTRALRDPKPLSTNEIRFLLRSAGFRRPLHTRLKRLSRVEYRHLNLAARLEIDTHTVRLNFDGLPYSAANRRRMLTLLKALDGRFDCRVAVTDTRFIPPFAATVRYDEHGITPARAELHRCRRARRSPFLRRFRSKNIPLCARTVKQIIAL